MVQLPVIVRNSALQSAEPVIVAEEVKLDVQGRDHYGLVWGGMPNRAWRLSMDGKTPLHFVSPNSAAAVRAARRVWGV